MNRLFANDKGTRQNTPLYTPAPVYATSLHHMMQKASLFVPSKVYPIPQEHKN